MPLTRQTPLTDLPGVGPQRAKKLEKLGLRTLGDTLDHLPQRYEDRRECRDLRDAPADITDPGRLGHHGGHTAGPVCRGVLQITALPPVLIPLGEVVQGIAQCAQA